MTVEDVAKLLRVSERTVYDWAQKGEIPGGKFGTSWRFKRSELTRWIDRRLKGAKKSTSALPLPLASVLDMDRIVFLEEDRKVEVLARLADVLSKAPQVHDRKELMTHIIHREELMSTGIGLGIGVPHVRLDSVDDIVMAVGVCRKPIADYDSLDGEPVRFVCMIAARANQHAKHIKLLSSLSQRWKDELVRETIYAAESPEQVFAALAGRE